MSRPAITTVCAALVLAGAALALAAAARADDAPSPGPRPMLHVVAPHRISGPSALDMANFYPRAAQRKGLGGDVMMHCMITPAGVLDACTITAETPPDEGFAAAALLLTSRFKYAPVAAPIPHDLHIEFVLPR